MKQKMTDSNCFVCLNRTQNKVCPTCSCYAHPSCWGHYLRSMCGVSIPIHIEPGFMVMEVPYSVSCPQCRTTILNVKPLTRSDTEQARYELLVTNMDSMIDQFDLSTNDQDRDDMLRDIFDTALRNKRFILQEPRLLRVINDKLKQLYDYGWYPSNLYYYYLNSKQILSTVNGDLPSETLVH